MALKTAAMSRTEDAITSAKTMGVTTKARGNLNAATDVSEPTSNGRQAAKPAGAKAAKAVNSGPVALVVDPAIVADLDPDLEADVDPDVFADDVVLEVDLVDVEADVDIAEVDVDIVADVVDPADPAAAIVVGDAVE